MRSRVVLLAVGLVAPSQPVAGSNRGPALKGLRRAVTRKVSPPSRAYVAAGDDASTEAVSFWGRQHVKTADHPVQADPRIRVSTSRGRFCTRGRSRRCRVALTVMALALAGFSGASSADAAPGDLDPTFSGDGKQTTSFGGRDNDAGLAAAVQPDGKTVAVGRGGSGGTSPSPGTTRTARWTRASRATA